MQNGDTIPTTGVLVVTTCWCGIKFAVPSEMNRWHRQDAKNAIYCPLGHSCVIRQTDTDRLRAAESRQRHLEDQLQASAREAEATRVALLRDRQRFANGVCPCCNRSFENVARHMKTEHPGYDVTKVEDHGSRATRFRCSCGMSFETLHGLRIHQGRSRSDGWDKPEASRWSAHLTMTGAK